MPAASYGHNKSCPQAQLNMSTALEHEPRHRHRDRVHFATRAARCTPNAIASDAQAVPQNCNVRGTAGRSLSRHRVLRRSLSHQQPWARCFVFSGAGGVVFYPRECRGRGIWLSKSGLAEFYSRNNGAACSLPTCTLNAAVREQHRRVSFQASPIWLSKSGLYSRINGAGCTNAFADEWFPGTPSTPILCIATA